MKKFVSFFITCIVFVSLFAFSAKGLDCCDLSAECAAVMCVQTGELLFQKNAHSRHSMASTTKIMTSLIALEQNTPDRIITADSASITVEGTSMGLQAGDKITLKSLVYGMLLLSGNDSANLTAKAVGGSIEKFALLMNKRAGEIGMKNTHFVTPSGLDDEKHYTTAYDMALLGCEAVKNPAFVNICSKKKAVVCFGNPVAEHTLYNHNKLLSYYDGALGIKTGFTRKSGRCLVSCAEKDGVMLVAVTLNAPSDWSDHKKMLDFGFSQINEKKVGEKSVSVPVTGGEQKSVTASSLETTLCKESITKHIFIEKFLYAPVKKGSVVGQVRYFSGGKVIETVPLVADSDVKAIPAPKKQPKQGIFQKIKDLFRRN